MTMTKNRALFLIPVIILVGGVLVAANRVSNDQEAMVNQESTMQAQEAMQPTNISDNPAEMMGDDNMVKQGQYVDYSKDVLNQSAPGRRVLFFYANWCPTCRPADTDFDKNRDKLPQDTTLIRVNYNDSDTDTDEKDLVVKYGITYQHTFVQIDSDGDMVARWNGGRMSELLANLK